MNSESHLANVSRFAPFHRTNSVSPSLLLRLHAEWDVSCSKLYLFIHHPYMTLIYDIYALYTYIYRYVNLRYNITNYDVIINITTLIYVNYTYS